jgi:hypothetical protein
MVPLNVTTALVNGATVATLTFPGTAGGSLGDGDWELHLNVAAIGVAGDRDFLSHRLFGDTNGDRRVDNADFFLLRAAYGQAAGQPGYRADLDANGDGRVDNLDAFQFRARFGTSLP